MNVSVKYFGALAEAINKESEQLEIGKDSCLNDFSELVESLYPQLQEHVFKIAVNQNIADDNIKINENDEVALLPPFAGG
jgi:molybdopterin synthase sulfur carrier subunit